MKAILASSGFNAKEAIEKCVEFVGKPASEINFAVIKEAMAVEFGDHKWFLEDMNYHIFIASILRPVMTIGYLRIRKKKII